MGEFSACQNADDSVLAQVHLSHLFAARVIYAFALNYHLVNYIQRSTYAMVQGDRNHLCNTAAIS